MKEKLGKLVVFGAHTLLGRMLIERLENSPFVESFLVVDLYPLSKSRHWTKARFVKMDVIQPGADEKLARLLEAEKIDTVVHCASKNNPSHNWANAHELEVIGTMHWVSAAKESKVKKFVFCSSTGVYGASPKNPNYLSENAPLDPHPQAHFIRDKIEAEKQVASLLHECPQVVTTILRFCLTVGPTSENYFTELFRRPIVLTLLGYDPLMQFIHESDAIDALWKSLEDDYRGIFNIVGAGVIPLSRVLREAGRTRLPVAPVVAYPFVQLLWNMQMTAVPGRLLDYFRYLWVADGTKAAQVMNFHPKFSSKEAFLDFAKTHELEETAWAV